MSNPLVGMTNHHITPEGVFTQDELIVAQIINDYDPQLQLVFIPDKPPGEMNCAVLCTPTNGTPPYPIFYLDRGAINQKLLARIFADDLSRSGQLPLDAWLQAEDSAREMFNQLKREEAIAEQNEFNRAVLKSKLHTYKHNGKVYR